MKVTLHILTHGTMRGCGLTSLVVCNNDKFCDIRERNVTIRSGTRSLGFQDIGECVILWSLRCTWKRHDVTNIQTDRWLDQLIMDACIIYYNVDYSWYNSIFNTKSKPILQRFPTNAITTRGNLKFTQWKKKYMWNQEATLVYIYRGHLSCELVILIFIGIQ